MIWVWMLRCVHSAVSQFVWAVTSRICRSQNALAKLSFQDVCVLFCYKKNAGEHIILKLKWMNLLIHLPGTRAHEYALCAWSCVHLYMYVYACGWAGAARRVFQRQRCSDLLSVCAFVMDDGSNRKVVHLVWKIMRRNVSSVCACVLQKDDLKRLCYLVFQDHVVSTFFLFVQLYCRKMMEGFVTSDVHRPCFRGIPGL